MVLDFILLEVFDILYMHDLMGGWVDDWAFACVEAWLLSETGLLTTLLGSLTVSWAVLAETESSCRAVVSDAERSNGLVSVDARTIKTQNSVCVMSKINQACIQQLGCALNQWQQKYVAFYHYRMSSRGPQFLSWSHLELFLLQIKFLIFYALWLNWLFHQ